MVMRFIGLPPEAWFEFFGKYYCKPIFFKKSIYFHFCEDPITSQGYESQHRFVKNVLKMRRNIDI
jgi:hypothetical protein